MYECTLAELLRIIIASKKNNIREYEHTRAIVFAIAAANRDPKKPMPSITDFWPLPTDEKQEQVADWVAVAEQRRINLRKLGYIKPIPD